MAPVYGVAAEAGDGGGDSKAVAGDAGLAFAQLRWVAKRIAGHGYLCRLFAAGGTIEGRQEIEVDPFDGSGRGAIDVRGATRLRNHGDESERNIFGAHGGTHNGPAAGAGEELSGLGAAPGSRALVAAGIVGQAAALDGNQWEGAADRGLRIDREGSGKTGEGVRDEHLGRDAIRGRRSGARREDFSRGEAARGFAGGRLCINRCARDCGDAASHRGGGNCENETRRKVDQRGARVAAGRGSSVAGARQWSAWRSRDRRCQVGAIAGGEPAVEGAEFVDHPTYERGERPALGPAGRGLARIAGEMVRRAGTI